MSCVPAVTGADGSGPGRSGCHWRRSLAWLWVGAFLVTLLVQVPGVGNIDTARRLQVTRSLWTEEPPVRPEEYPAFGIRSRTGTIHAWYGVGQSLLMLPADLVAAAFERSGATPEERRSIRSGVVATLTFPPLDASTVVLAALWLVELGFSRRQALRGALGLLLGSTFLHYCQIHMENSLQDFLLFADALCLLVWVRTGGPPWLALSALSVAIALLVRLPALGEHMVPWLVALVLMARRAGTPLTPGGAFRDFRMAQVLAIALPLVLAGVGADRWYHFHRFGTWEGTYIGLQGEDARLRDATLPANYPFDGNFWHGFLGPWISPERSMLLFDPLLWLVIGVVVLRWRALRLQSRSTLIATALSLLILTAFYARCSFWEGGASWSNRYTLTPVHLLAAMAVPLWDRHVSRFHPWGRAALGGVLGLAAALQVLSLVLPTAVERGQAFHEGHPLLVIDLRVRNVAALLGGSPAPPGVPPELWRINLAPATLAGQRPALRTPLWIAWAGGLVLAGWAVRRALAGCPQTGPAASPPAPGSGAGQPFPPRPGSDRG